MDFKSFHDYLSNVEPVPFLLDVPSYPAHKPEDPEYWKPKDLDEYILKGNELQQQQQHQQQLHDVMNRNKKDDEEISFKQENYDDEKMETKEGILAITKNVNDLEVDAIENDAKDMEYQNENIETLKKILPNNMVEDVPTVTRTKIKAGSVAQAIVPALIYKYMGLNVLPPPTPPPAPPTPPPPPTPAPVSPAPVVPLSKTSMAGLDITTTTTTTTTTPTTTKLQDEVLKVESKKNIENVEKRQQQKFKKHKKNKMIYEFGVVATTMTPTAGPATAGADITPTTSTVSLPLMNTTTNNENKDEKEKKKRSAKKALKQQQQQKFQQIDNEEHNLMLLQQTQNNTSNSTQLEKYQKKQDRLKQKLLKQQQKQKKLQHIQVQQLERQFYQQQQQQHPHQQKEQKHEHELFMLNNQRRKKEEEAKNLTSTLISPTSNTVFGPPDQFLKKPKIEEPEFDFFPHNNNNNNSMHKLQQQFEVNLPNLPTGTTITPAPPILKNSIPSILPASTYPPTTLSGTAHTLGTNDVGCIPIKVGKKRGRKPGSKNQPKISHPPTPSINNAIPNMMYLPHPPMEPQHLLMANMLDASGGGGGGLGGMGICGMTKMTEKGKKLHEAQYTPPTLPRHLLSSNIIDFKKAQQQYQQQEEQQQQEQQSQLPKERQQKQGNQKQLQQNSGGAMDLTTNFLQQQLNNYPSLPQVPFTTDLFPFATTARPGLIPSTNPAFFPQGFPPPPTPVDLFPFMQQQKQQQENRENFMQHQQQLGIKNTEGSNQYICKVPPLLPDHLKIPPMPKQPTTMNNKKQQHIKQGNFIENETIDLLSDDSDDHSMITPKKSNIQQQQQQHPLQQLFQQQNMIMMNNKKKTTSSNTTKKQQDIMNITATTTHLDDGTPVVSKLAGGADLIPLTNTGLAYSSQNIPHTSLTGGVNSHHQLGGGAPGVELLGDITITKTISTTAANDQQLYDGHQQRLAGDDDPNGSAMDEDNINKKKHTKKEHKKMKKIKEGKINKKNKKEKKDKDKKHKLEKLLLKQQHQHQHQHQQQQQMMEAIDVQQQHQRDLLKKQKREKKKEKQQQRLSETMMNINSTNFDPNASDTGTGASAVGIIPKLTLKLAGKNSPITTMTTPKEQHQLAITTTKPTIHSVHQDQPIQQPQQQQQLSREYSPELAKFSPLVTRPPKQKNATITPPPAPLVIPPPPPSSWTSGDTFPASSVLLPSQLFGCNEQITAPTVPPTTLATTTTKSKDDVDALSSTSSSVMNVDLNNIRPHSYVDADGNRIWICPACGKVDDGSPMIGCDGCDAWYHW